MAETFQGRVLGKKAFITGGAQGLGAAAARMLARHGAKVALADLNLEGAQAVADEINATHGAGAAFAFKLDVRDEAQWIYALEAADAAMGGISVLLNNAGIIQGRQYRGAVVRGLEAGAGGERRQRVSWEPSTP